MKTLLSCVLLVVCCVKISAAATQFRCDYTYVEQAKGWLKYHEIPATWKDARLRCQMEGATLASPVDQDLSEAMADMIKKNSPNCAVFTGIHATFSKGDYTTIDGVPLSHIPHTWAPGEPDNYNNEEDCLVILTDKTLADVKCSETHSYMCYNKHSNSIVTECGTTDTAYKLDARNGKCYKFHTVPATWSKAYMACMAEGGHLAIINSETESTIIKELFAKYPARTMVGNFWKDVAFIGFHDWGQHFDWRTIHGKTLTAAGFNKFSPGEPNNSTTGEYCGSVYRTGLLNDLWCEKFYAFICEKAPSELVCNREENEE